MMKKDSGVAERATRCKDGERRNMDSRKADQRSISSGDPLHQTWHEEDLQPHQYKNNTTSTF